MARHDVDIVLVHGKIRLTPDSSPRLHRGTTAHENGHHPVTPSPSREGRGIWGGGGDAPPQMLRRCGWLSM
ncbi:MAG: hypothetical protein J4N78_03575, partial [Chloroflexi bacterium]|nr:hypothetical protein [Chloroflexota bacterium]